MVLSRSWASQASDTITFNGKDSTSLNFYYGTPVNVNSNYVWIFSDLGVNLRKTTYSAEIEVTDLMRKAYSRGWAKSSPVLNFIKAKIETNGIVTANIHINLTKVLSQTTCCEYSTIMLSNRAVTSQVLENVASPNYCKVFFSNGSELAQVTFGFDFRTAAFGLKVISE
jgi:hypothetical protein